jgi:hypothetical protein
VTLLLAGFYVGIGCEIGDKAETTIASNSLALLERPLGTDWFKRLKISHNCAPFRGNLYKKAPIGPEDFLTLQSLAQFQNQ